MYIRANRYGGMVLAKRLVGIARERLRTPFQLELALVLLIQIWPNQTYGEDRTITS